MPILDLGNTPLLEQQEVALDEIVGQVVQRLTPRAIERSVKIRRMLSPGLTALGDAAAIRRVLERLLGNAVEASPPGTVHIQGYPGVISRQTLEKHSGNDGFEHHVVPVDAGVDYRLQDHQIQVVELIIRDFGAPIPARLQPFLFDRVAYQPPPNRAGLPFVAELVTAMRGVVWVEADSLERSCIFHVVLPMPLSQPLQKVATTGSRVVEQAYPQLP